MKTKSPISQRAFNKKMKEMGYDLYAAALSRFPFKKVPARSRKNAIRTERCGLGKRVKAMGKRFFVMMKTEMKLPKVNGGLECFVFREADLHHWPMNFRDAKAALEFVDKVEEFLTKAVALQCDDETIKKQLLKLVPGVRYGYLF